MSTSSQIALGALRQQVRYRADIENNLALSDAELNGYISNSYKRLYGMLVGAYGNDYAFATAYQFSTSSAQFYPLPDGSPTYQNINGNTASKFYKLLGVDLQYSASPTGYISLKNFNFIERNRFGYPNTTVNLNGYTNLRYRLEGNNLYLVPIPTTGQTVQLWYIPAPSNLQFTLPTGITNTGTSISFSDVTGLTSGMNVYGNGIGTNTTLVSVNSNSNTAVISQPAQATLTSAILSFWNDSTLMEGITGWDEFVVVDAAIKAQIKQENPIDALLAERADMVAEIEALAEGRDAGQPFHVSDTLALNGFNGGAGEGGWGMGGGDCY